MTVGTPVTVYYYGPLEEPGHFLYSSAGKHIAPHTEEAKRIPWMEGYEIDGKLAPKGPQEQGPATLHYKYGWTALSFWDRTIDKRLGSSSTYVAEGLYRFSEMVLLAKSRFPERWNKMEFEVTAHE